MTTTCCHAPPQPAAPHTPAACADCGATEQLRICNHCGRLGCADSRHGHAVAHAQAAEHPVMREYAPNGDDGWVWCARCGEYVVE